MSLRDQSIIQYLLDNGGSINPINPKDYSLIGHAARNTDCKTVEFLLRNGADLSSSVDGCPNPALSSAVENGNYDILSMLISHADDDILLKSGAAIAVAAAAGDLEMVKALLASGMDLESSNFYGEKALHAACSSHDPLPEVVAYLLCQNAEINARDNSGNTPCML